MALANLHQFPIIVFHEAVPFVRITQDLHSQIINQQYLLISSLESYSQALNKNAVLGQNTEDILQNMYNELKTQIMFSIKDGAYLFPNMAHKSVSNY